VFDKRAEGSMSRGVVFPVALLGVIAAEGACFAQQQSWCVPGTQVCAQGDGKGGVKVGGSAQGQADPSGASGTAAGNADANAGAGASGSAGGQRQGQGGYAPPRYSRPTPFGTGATFCATVKAGVHSGVKAGGCFALSFRWEPLFFEMETQLLFGGKPRSIDWLFPMSFVIPLTSDDNLYEGLQLRGGGTPIGVTFARTEGRRNYVRFGLHAGLSYELDFSDAAAWRVFDARAFLDFGTKEIDDRGHTVDYGAQLATGIVL
jgi:hypothetical protein